MLTCFFFWGFFCALLWGVGGVGVEEVVVESWLGLGRMGRGAKDKDDEFSRDVKENVEAEWESGV
jgi:hypothetical protein